MYGPQNSGKNEFSETTEDRDHRYCEYLEGKAGAVAKQSRKGVDMTVSSRPVALCLDPDEGTQDLPRGKNVCVEGVEAILGCTRRNFLQGTHRLILPIDIHE